MKNERASSTAVLIAAGLVLLRHNPNYPDLVSATSADLCSQILKLFSAKTRLLSKMLRQRWFRLVAAAIEHFTIPGILRHYALRKKCLANLTREALADGITQIIVLGAGFDPLAMELQHEFREARFWEIDHPATQRYKSQVAGDVDLRRFHFIVTDLRTGQLDTKTLKNTSFESAQRSFWIAEGLLMYFPKNIVANLLTGVAKLSAPGSRFAFTFMQPRRDGRIRFQRQTRLVDDWLNRRGEPFLWGVDRDHISEFVQPWQVLRIFDEADLRALDSSSRDFPLAAGELICLAQIP